MARSGSNRMLITKFGTSGKTNDKILRRKSNIWGWMFSLKERRTGKIYRISYLNRCMKTVPLVLYQIYWLSSQSKSSSNIVNLYMQFVKVSIFNRNNFMVLYSEASTYYLAAKFSFGLVNFPS